MRCRHRWGDVCVGMITHQQDRTCLKCGLVQHTLQYASNDWLDGPPLAVEKFRERAQWIADNFLAMG